MFNLVVNPNPDLVAMIPPPQRERFVRQLTERVVDGFFEARGLDTGCEYAYVVHHRQTDDPQSPGLHNPHTHVVLPGTVYDEEHELIARHVADGNGSENPAAREKEARATVASAYRQAPREPIAAPKEHARQTVGQLVGRFEAEQKTDRPTTRQIVEAVEACIHLNSVEWAEERQRLKAVCGEGLKIGDIDRLYKEKKRELERQRQHEYVDTESYVLLDGRMIYRKESYRGTLEKTVTDWSATALHQTCQVDDDGREMHVTTIELQRGSSTKNLEVPGEVFVDDIAMRRFIGANAGAQYVVRAGMSKHLVPAIVQLSGEFPTHRHYNFMGWMQLDGDWVYVSPGDCITAQGKLTEPLSVELDQRLRDYGLQMASWSEGLAAFDAVTKVMPPQLAPALIAFALLPVLQRFFPTTATRPAVHLVGTSGSGKSEIASLLSSFYGNFSRDTPPAQWDDTINTVKTLGYPLADTIFWVDDYKSIYADEKTFTRFLQSYSRGMGRGRLTREAKVRQEKPCRGLILSTGETTIEGEMSVIAQMLAHNVADAYGQTFPEPMQLPALGPRPEYYFGYGVGPNGAPSLEAVKTWMDGAERRFDTLTISEHASYEDAAADEYILETTRIVGGVEQALNVAERWSADNGYLDPRRDDPRIFFADDAPPDAFTTHRARELGPDVAAEPEAAVDIPHWRFDTLPVNDPDGEPLGQSLHMVVYPHLEHDPESPAISPDEPFHMLEVAHFETDEAAEKFIADFNGYLMPGLLEGPELAQEVARLEGLPVEWKTLDGDDLTAYQNLTLTLTRDAADWQPYNPNADAMRGNGRRGCTPTPSSSLRNWMKVRTNHRLSQFHLRSSIFDSG